MTPQQLVNFNPAANPIVPLPRQPYNPNFVDLTRPRPNFVHSIESKEVGIGEQNNNNNNTATLAALTPVKKEPVYDSRPLYNANNTTVTPATVTPEKSVMNELTSDITGLFSKVKDDNTNLKKNVNFMNESTPPSVNNEFITPKKSREVEDTPTSPHVLNLDSNIYRERQEGLFCGKHAINHLLGGPIVSKDDMGTYCAECSNSPEPVCGDLGENCDISVLIYILATKKEKVGDFKLVVMPEEVELTDECIQNLDNVYFDVRSEHCIMNHLYKNVLGCIVRINNNHFVTYKNNNDGTFSLLDSLKTDTNVPEFEPVNLATALMKENVTGIIIVKEGNAHVLTCNANKKIGKLVDVHIKKIEASQLQNDSNRNLNVDEKINTSTETTSESVPADAPDNTQTYINDAQHGQATSFEETERDKIRNIFKVNDQVIYTPATATSESIPYDTDGAENSNAALGTAFYTRGESNENTPSTTTKINPDKPNKTTERTASETAPAADVPEGKTTAETTANNKNATASGWDLNNLFDKAKILTSNTFNRIRSNEEEDRHTPLNSEDSSNDEDNDEVNQKAREYTKSVRNLFKGISSNEEEDRHIHSGTRNEVSTNDDVEDVEMNVDCTINCAGMEDPESIAICIQKNMFDIDDNLLVINKKNETNQRDEDNAGGRLTKQNTNLKKENTTCKVRYNKISGSKYDDDYPSLKGGKSRRKKKSAKKGSQSIKKKHTKKHRKNSRRKTKSMKRVKKLKK